MRRTRLRTSRRIAHPRSPSLDLTLRSLVRTADLRLARRTSSESACLDSSLEWLSGAETDEVHAALKFNFCPKRFIGNLVAPSSTAKLDTIAFTDYIEKVRRWAAEELSINIPDPGEVAA
jgi:hypothetical protein